MTAETVFLTGFPGFLGSALVDTILARDDRTVTCLVQPKYRELAEDRREELETANDAGGRVGLVDGNVSDPDLGLVDGGQFGYDAIAARITEVYHLAAVYDLAVDREVGMAVNVDGTKHVLEFCTACDDLERLHYVSTCYVSGRYPGEFTEEMLIEGQSFNNHYESTKFLAEVAVQDRMDDGLPATIYRPSIAVGDSQTGETQKYDGPYAVIRYLLSQPRVAVLPAFDGRDVLEANVVPRDFVVDAIAAIGARDDTVGSVYHLADPNPPTVAEMESILADASDTRVLHVPVPEGAFQWALRKIDAFRDWTGIDPALVDYFTHPTRYDTTNASTVLADEGIECPPFGAYAQRLVDFVRTNPHVDSDAMT